MRDIVFYVKIITVFKASIWVREVYIIMKNLTKKREINKRSTKYSIVFRQDTNKH